MPNLSELKLPEKAGKKRMLQAISVDEMAKRLGVHVNTIRSLAASGEIPAMRVGHQWRFHISDVEKTLRDKADPKKRAGGRK